MHRQNVPRHLRPHTASDGGLPWPCCAVSITLLQARCCTSSTTLLSLLSAPSVAAVGPVRLGRGGALLRAEAQRRPYPSCSSLSPRRSTEGAYLKAFKILTTLQMLMAPSWRVVLNRQPRLVAGTSVFEGKHEVLHSLTSLGWRLASHSIGHGPEDGATGCGLSVSAPNVLSECVSASFTVCQGSRLISVARSGVHTRREWAEASVKVLSGLSNALGMAGNEPS